MRVNTLVVGQGIAGSLVAFMLHQQNISYMVVDPGYPNTASKVAAGMFTPISGKRKTIHENVLQQISFAIDTYKKIGELIGKNILHLENIYEIPASAEEQNILDKRSGEEKFEKYILHKPGKLPNIKQEFKSFEITNSGWVDCSLFINSFRDWLKQKDALIEEIFDYSALHINKDFIQYKNSEAENIIFCEGYSVSKNPFFLDENIIPCKGDVLTIEYKNFDTNYIVKKDSCYLVHSEKNMFKTGSTYQWNNNDKTLEESGRKEIESKLNAMLENEYTVINHQSAIRPTTQNREVIARRHTVDPRLFMLNGLGTKGILQGPWWAKYVVGLM